MFLLCCHSNSVPTFRGRKRSTFKSHPMTNARHQFLLKHRRKLNYRFLWKTSPESLRWQNSIFFVHYMQTKLVNSKYEFKNSFFPPLDGFHHKEFQMGVIESKALCAALRNTQVGWRNSASHPTDFNWLISKCWIGLSLLAQVKVLFEDDHNWEHRFYSKNTAPPLLHHPTTTGLFGNKNSLLYLFNEKISEQRGSFRHCRAKLLLLTMAAFLVVSLQVTKLQTLNWCPSLRFHIKVATERDNLEELTFHLFNSCLCVLHPHTQRNTRRRCNCSLNNWKLNSIQIDGRDLTLLRWWLSTWQLQWLFPLE